MSRVAWRLAVFAAVIAGSGAAQDALVVRPDPPALDDFEVDSDGDGVPDGWYNLRDARLTTGGRIGPTLLRFEAERPSRPARISRGFGLDGRVHEAMIVSLWVRHADLLNGERVGEEPALLIDLLDGDLISAGRGMMGPFRHEDGEGWIRWSKRIPVPLATRDAIMTVGLLGATGRLDIDGLSIELVPVGGDSTDDLIVNGGFELGDTKPTHWTVEGKARRSDGGRESPAALTLGGTGAKALISLGQPVRGVAQLMVVMSARGEGLRSSGGALGLVYFLDQAGRALPNPRRVARWGGTFAWREVQGRVDVPEEAAQAIVQIETTDSKGMLRVDDVRVVALNEAGGGTAITWNPYHESADTSRWAAYSAAPAIEAGSALDASFLLDAPAGTHGFARAKGGQLEFGDGTPARFFGVTLLPPVSFVEPDLADRLADRIARSGVNLVRLGDLDTPLGLGVSLLDDASDTTTELDLASLANFDHLVAALIARGIYVALELQSQVRLREGDGLAGARALPPGGGPALGFDPVLRDRLVKVAKALLDHVNPETGRAYRDEPAVAWVTLSGEASLFDQIDGERTLPEGLVQGLRKASAAAKAAGGRQGWQKLESQQWRSVAEALRADGLRVPIAGSSHWRREAEFVAAISGTGLDLVDDRLFWSPPRFGDPSRRSLLFDGPENGLRRMSTRKRRAQPPYVVGQYASFTEGAWSLPFEGADLIFMATVARHEGWAGLTRRGVARYPEDWGAAATGTGGGPDVYPTTEALNANPQVFSMLPYAATIALEPPGGVVRRGGGGLPGWDYQSGTLRVDRPDVQGIVGWNRGQPASFADWKARIDNPFAIALLASRDGRAIADSGRLLLTVIGRVQPTGFRYVDAWRAAVADPGRAPLVMEPMSGEVEWTGGGRLTVHALDSAGRRAEVVPTEVAGRASRFPIGGSRGTMHWELLIER